MKLETPGMNRDDLHDIMGTAISPLPIAFISTVGPDGTYNAAPFSFVCPVCSKPPLVCVSIGTRKGEKKDTWKNIEFSRDFVVNTVDEAILKQAVQASAAYPYGVDEIKKVGLTAVRSDKVKAPRIAEAKVSLECSLLQKVDFLEELDGGPGLRTIIFGEVLVAHVKDEVATDGRIDPRKLKAIGRIGKDTYFTMGKIFELKAEKV